MTSILKVAVAAVVVLASTCALADTIQLGSYATGASSMGNANSALNFAGFNASSTTPSSGTANSFTLSQDATWGTPLANTTWVGSAATSGPVGTVNPAMGYYTFTTTFNGNSSSPYNGNISIMADDTAEVLLNGNLVLTFGTLGADTHCAAGNPSCMAAFSSAFSGVSLLSGTNTLTFVVQQAGNISATGEDPSGLDFAATLTSAAVPEPGTLALLATGMFALGGAFLMRRKIGAVQA